MKKTKDLRDKTPQELHETLLGLRKEQTNMRFKRANGTLEKTHEQRTTRRAIARVKTLLTQKEGKT